MAKAIKGKGGRTRTPTTGRPPKRKSSQQDKEEGTDADSGFGIGMVWSCQDAR